MKKEYDAVVVGAGPAGSTFARIAAEKGLSVLLVEKRKEIGAPKRCGEGLSMNAITKAGLKPEPEWVRQEIEGAFIFAPNGKRIDAKYGKASGYTIERKQFDKWLAFLAAEAGADVVSGTRASGLIKENNKITGVVLNQFSQTFNVSANLVVAADGVESKVARWAGINSTHLLKEYCAGVQFEMANVEPVDQKMLEVYMGNKIAPGGYVWVFPKGEKRANVGIGVRTMESGSALKYLQAFVSSHENLKNGSIIEINGGGIPVGAPLEKISADNLMIVGDAAHQVNPIHGGGIGEAMRAAAIAAAVARKAADKNDFTREALKEYDEEWYNNGDGAKLKKLATLREIIEKMSDDELNALADAISGGDVVSLAMAQKFSLLAKVLAKNPRFLRFVPKLLSMK